MSGITDVLARLKAVAGGPARLRVIVLLAAVIAVTGAAQATAGAVAPGIERALQVDNTGVGSLITATGTAAGLTTLAAGVLADRRNRVHLLAAALLVCTAAMVVGGAAPTYPVLIFAAVGMGVGAGAIGPAVASLTGDLFAAGSRGRIYGYILTAEIGGSAVGLLVAGEVAAWWSWRGSFWALGLLCAALGAALLRLLPEPARGGQNALEAGATRILPAAEAVAARGDGTAGGTAEPTTPAAQQRGPGGRGPAADDDVELPSEVRRLGIEPHESLILTRDPSGRPLWWAIRYVLSIRTNVVFIVASALGYFFFSGLQTFAVIFVRARFGLGQGAATMLILGVGTGALLGVLTSGRLADWMITRHCVAARPIVSGACFLLTAAAFVPALFAGSLLVAAPLFFVGAAALGGMNPPLDAARLDIMHSRLWGRAESVRTFLQTALKAAAPILLGYASVRLSRSSAGSYATTVGTYGSQRGLHLALLFSLIPLCAGGLLLLLAARRTYPADVATALRSEQETAGK